MKGKALMKGQLEFVIVAAIILLALVGIVLMVQQLSIKPPVTNVSGDEPKLIKDSVINLVDQGLREQLVLLYGQGGVFMPDPYRSVEAGPYHVPIWSQCYSISVPDVENELQAGVASYLKTRLKPKMDFYGKTVEFDYSHFSVDAEIIDGFVRVKVTLPTNVEGYEMPMPYEAEVSSDLKNILDFSTNFIRTENDSYFFEFVTMNSLLHSNPESPDFVPLAGIQGPCGNVLYRSRSSLEKGLLESIRYTTSHVVMNDIPLRSADNPFYPIRTISGRTYRELNVTFSYPPSWDDEFDRYFDYSPNPLRIVPERLHPIMPVCATPYGITYTFRYPVIISVHDSRFNQWFSFASMVGVEENLPETGCSQGDNTSRADEYLDKCIRNARCEVNIQVNGTHGEPIAGADAVFYICDLGKTDSRGKLQGNVPCIISQLNVFKEGYGSFGELTKGSALANKSIRLQRLVPNVTFSFNSVPVLYGNGKFSVINASEDPFPLNDVDPVVLLLSVRPGGQNFFEEQRDFALSNMDENDSLVSDYTFEGLLPDYYETLGYGSDGSTGNPVAFMNDTFELREMESTVYLNIPVVYESYWRSFPFVLMDYRLYREPLPENSMERLMALLRGCGIDPASTIPQSFSSAECSEQ